MNIKVLASSSEGNAYLVGDGKTQLLLECGIPISELKIKSNFFDPPIDACLVSHSHGDHAKSVKDIMRLGIPCYMSKETFVEIEQPRFVELIEHRKKFKVGTFEILPLEMKHDVYCLGFYIYSSETEETLFFATDTCYIPYIMPPLDYIMVEANYDLDILNDHIMNGKIDPIMKSRLARSHMSINATVKWLKRQDFKKTKRIYLMHLSYGNSNIEDFKRRVMECTGVPTTIC